MNVRKLSVNKACIFLAVLLLTAMVTVSVALYVLTQDITAVWYVLLFGIFVLFCSICFMVLVRRKLAMFSDAFCSLMDDMLSGNMQPKQTVEEESLFYKIEYRLNRLYEVMQENKNSIAKERTDLQELISDISHQVKTPIANLKMINSTLLENEVPVQKQKEFLTAQASQLDKLDFLMQAMIKTSRLETGVISLEKKSQPLYDTLAAALGGILLNTEKKQINVKVDCPESLIVSHDRKWQNRQMMLFVTPKALDMWMMEIMLWNMFGLAVRKRAGVSFICSFQAAVWIRNQLKMHLRPMQMNRKIRCAVWHESVLCKSRLAQKKIF